MPHCESSPPLLLSVVHHAASAPARMAPRPPTLQARQLAAKASTASWQAATRGSRCATCVSCIVSSMCTASDTWGSKGKGSAQWAICNKQHTCLQGCLPASARSAWLAQAPSSPPPAPPKHPPPAHLHRGGGVGGQRLPRLLHQLRHLAQVAGQGGHNGALQFGCGRSGQHAHATTEAQNTQGQRRLSAPIPRPARDRPSAPSLTWSSTWPCISSSWRVSASRSTLGACE